MSGQFDFVNVKSTTRPTCRTCRRNGYEVLTTTAYHCQHYFNPTDSRSQKRRPPSEWISLKVPVIIAEDDFNVVQALPQSRAPSRVPLRVTNSPTLLAGVDRCGNCAGPLIQDTGKGGMYRYYCCARKLKEGAMSCEGLRMLMDKLGSIVINEVVKNGS